jgi:threonine synthase
MEATFVCPVCGVERPADPTLWRCPTCGGPWDLVRTAAIGDEPLAGQGVWRYQPWLPVERAVSLGEPATPILRPTLDGLDVVFKLEGALPTGSFKDRGAAVLVAALAEHGVAGVLEDSSGNAGAALAAYCARAGIACEIYLPAGQSGAKLNQILAYGATPVPIEGPRQAATDAAEAAAERGAVYASHAWSPFYLAGTQTFAFELWEQLGGTAPDVLVLPVGGGSLLLGAHLGFAALAEAGRIARPPRLVAVQAAACAPFARAVAEGSAVPAVVEAKSSVAEGISIARPVRGAAVLSAIAATSGTALAVEEAAIPRAHRRLARSGVFVEPTSAVALAGLEEARRAGLVQVGETVVVALTGNGLKTAARAL